MSKKLRIEEEKAQHLKDELQEEEGKLKQQQERIFGPLVWRRYPNGMKIQDLQENLFEDTIQLILDHYLSEDVLFRNTQFAKDKLSQQCFAERLRFKMKDRGSIVMIDEAQNQLIGALVLAPVQKCDYGRVYSRAMIVEGKSYQSITEFINYVNRKVDIFDQFSCEIYLKYYLICVHPNYRHKGLGYQLMGVGIDVARHLKIPVVMGVFSNYQTQKIAKKIGMDQILFEYKFTKWADPKNELVFCDIGPGNYTCNVQAGIVNPLPPPSVDITTKNETNQKMTRAEKRKGKK